MAARANGLILDSLKAIQSRLEAMGTASHPLFCIVPVKLSAESAATTLVDSSSQTDLA